MADDNLDLDTDDLDLGDDSGDDFGGDLDGILGDDDIGGDSSDSDSSDGELDSFFEDLSSIEEMDGPDEPDEPVAETPVASAAVQAAPPTQEIQTTTPGKKKGKKGLMFFILLIILGSAGGGGYWYLTKYDGKITQADKPKKESLFEKQTITIAPEKEPEPIIEAPVIKPVAKPVVKIKRYLVQIASCEFAQCIEDHSKMLRELGQPVFQRQTGKEYDLVELISSEVYDYRNANNIKKKINQENKDAGEASIKAQDNGYRITLGTFNSLQRAKNLKVSIGNYFPDETYYTEKKVEFNLEHIRESFKTTKVFAGPYDSRKIASIARAKLQKQPKIISPFLIRY